MFDALLKAFKDFNTGPEERTRWPFIVVGQFPITNVVMTSRATFDAAMEAAIQLSLSITGPEFVVYERRGSCSVHKETIDHELTPDSDEIESMTNLDGGEPAPTE